MNSDKGLHGEASCKEPWALGERKQRGETYSYPKHVNPLSSVSSEHLFFE